MLPNECQPAPVKFPVVRADASIDRPEEFPNDCQLPIAPRDSCVRDAPEEKVPERPKLLEVCDEEKRSLPELEPRAKFPDGRDENSPDLANELLLMRSLLLFPPFMRALDARLLP
jgi:hypothetical protein